MPQTVIAESQFSIARLMRPEAGYVSRYSGATVAVNPLYLIEGPNPLDDRAGEPGYALNLRRGLPVSLGNRVLLYLPRLTYNPDGNPNVRLGYVWTIVWRLRSLADFRRGNATARPPYHIPQQDAGDPGPGGPEVIIPAAYQSIVFNQPEPVGVPVGNQNVRGVPHLRAEDVNVASGALMTGLVDVPGFGTVSGVIQQGVSGFFSGGAPSYLIHEVQAAGDEMILGVYRDDGPPTWDITVGGTDESLLVFQNTQNFGVYVMTGVAP